MVNDVAGNVEELFVASGTMVQNDTPLMRLSNKEIELEIRAALAQREETLALKVVGRSLVESAG